MKSKDDENEKAMFAKGKPQKFKPRPKCEHCRKPGHKSEDCWIKFPHKKPEKYQKKNQNSDESANNANTKCYAFTSQELNPKATWIVDSGASCHMTAQKELFQTYKPVCKKVYFGNNQTLDAIGIGNVDIKTKEGTQIMLSNVLHVPGLHQNLLSVQAIAQQGHKITFVNQKCKIEQSGNVISLGNTVNNVYTIETALQAEVNNEKEEDIAKLWHQRFGHSNYKFLQNLSKSGSVLGLPQLKQYAPYKDDLCIGCLQGKQQREPFQQREEFKTDLIELIHSDLCGPITPTGRNGERYVLTFIDDKTRHFYVTMTKTKSFLNEFKIFKNLVENKQENESKYSEQTMERNL